MFSKKIPVIYISKDTLKVALISIGKSPKVLKSDETGWNKDSLVDTFKEAASQLKVKKIRLLLADDFNYLVNLKIPSDTDLKKQRQIISDKLKETIPEILDNDDWDYKETGKKDQTDKELIAFAPIKSKFSLIINALSQAGLTAEVVEPESISKLKNPDSLIGIALKRDIGGKDEQVLNPQPKLSKDVPQETIPSVVDTAKESDLPLAKTDKSKTQPPDPLSEKPSLKPSKKLIIIFLVTLTLGALIAGGILTSRKALNKKPTPTPTPLAIASPDPSPEASPSATPEPEVNPQDYSVLVLNGTGGKGVAGVVKDILLAEDFEDVIADNADELDHTKTTIQLKKDAPDSLFKLLERVLNSDYEIIKSDDSLTDDNDYDVIITVGDLIIDE